MPNAAADFCLLCQCQIDRTGRPGPAPSYCSQRCRRTAWESANPDKVTAMLRRKRDRARAATEAMRAALVKTCPQCNSTFSPEKRAHQLYCSTACKRRADAVGDLETPCSVDGCARGVRYRKAQLCGYHYSARRRAEFGRKPTKPQPWDDRRRDAYHRRRAQ